MKKSFIVLACAVAALCSCEEWEPVFSFGKNEPAMFEPASKPSGTDISIASLKALYTGKPVDIEQDYILTGKVVSSDESGNIYRSMYIQDETGGLELKVGKSSLYSDYKLGQTVYVKCSGLTLGDYNGMLQLGYKSSEAKYETAYIDVQWLIDQHIVKGAPGDALDPIVLNGSQMTDASYLGRYVEIRGCTYSSEIFAILYGKDESSLYLSDKGTYGIDSWAMTQNGLRSRMTSNGKEEPQSAFEGAITAENWQNYYDGASACTMSQYFSVPGTKTALQVRTSGYAKFADTPIDSGILSGRACTLRGILTQYKDNIQFTLIDLETGVEVE